MAEAGHEQEQGHPTAGTYLRVAAILVVLTVLEVGVFYVPAFHPVLVPTLLVLSACKFALVVLFYMQLALAAVVMVALLFLFFGTLTLRGAGG